MEPRNVFWKTEFKLPNTQWTLSGYSRSAYRSGFYVHGLNIMLDGGPQSFKKPDNVFITHCHGDHIAELPFTMIQDVPGEESKINLYCPEEAKGELRNYIMQLHNTNSLQDTSSMTDSYYNMKPLSSQRATQRVILNKQPMMLDTVGADHSVPTVVYGFSMVKDKLDPKYASLSGKEIGVLRKQKIPVTVEVIEKKFCYVLDTSIKVLEESPFLLEYPIIIIECTFLFDDELPLASQKKHIHWLELKPYILKNPNSLFILTHFSMRYKDREIREFFDEIQKKESIANIHPWMTDPVQDPDQVTITKTELQALKCAQIELEALKRAQNSQPLPTLSPVLTMDESRVNETTV